LLFVQISLKSLFYRNFRKHDVGENKQLYQNQWQELWQDRKHGGMPFCVDINNLVGNVGNELQVDGECAVGRRRDVSSMGGIGWPAVANWADKVCGFNRICTKLALIWITKIVHYRKLHLERSSNGILPSSAGVAGSSSSPYGRLFLVPSST